MPCRIKKEEEYGFVEDYVNNKLCVAVILEAV